tara:strand:- start:132 stop:527 length:396 start_codon:yes stop_codon:yes gene_type:complete
MIKLKNYYKNIIVLFSIFLSFLICSTISFANELHFQEKVKEITKELRCMTCQNQTIYESETEFSLQIKSQVLKLVKSGKSKEEVINYLEQRYGEYLLFKPQFNKKNLILWAFPFVALLISVFILLIKFRKD